MASFTKEAHLNAVLRRRIKYVVEKGAMAGTFKHEGLQNELFSRLVPAKIASLSTRDEYDNWVIGLIREDCWQPYSQNGLDQDRWGYFAKLLNILIYEIIRDRELVSDCDWQRLQHFVHIPLDSVTLSFLTELDPSIPDPGVLRDMTEKQYLEIQATSRRLADRYEVPPIWFEDAWSETTSDTTRDRQRKRNRIRRQKIKAALEFAIEEIMKEKVCT